MEPARIAELLEPFLGTAHDQGLTTNDVDRISTYIDILLRWNARINLTAIRDPEQIVTRHFGESLFAARHLFPVPSSVSPVSSVVKSFDVGARSTPAIESENRPIQPEQREKKTRLEGGRAALQGRVTGAEGIRASAPAGFANSCSVADLGSGAGFPGIPIKLWDHAVALTLIESNHKKATFLREVTRALTLMNVNVFAGRAEQLQPSTFDLVTLRAVERFANVVPVAASLVSPGGRLALLIGTSQLDQAQSSLPLLTWDQPLPVPLSQSRTLLVGHRGQ